MNKEEWVARLAKHCTQSDKNIKLSEKPFDKIDWKAMEANWNEFFMDVLGIIASDLNSDKT